MLTLSGGEKRKEIKENLQNSLQFKIPRSCKQYEKPLRSPHVKCTEVSKILAAFYFLEFCSIFLNVTVHLACQLVLRTKCLLHNCDKQGLLKVRRLSRQKH